MEQDLRAIRAGIKGETEAAYLIYFRWRSSDWTAVIHDLRLEIDGRVAQIDHLLLHRTLNVFVLETKHFHAGIKITEEGEFLRWNDYKKTYEGMASPLEQNQRHLAVLNDAFDRIEMPSRLGVRLTPVLHSYVVVSPNVRIDRPKRFDTSHVIKADMLEKMFDDHFDKAGVVDTFGNLGRFVSAEVLQAIGRQLVALHKPAPFDGAGGFGVPVQPAAASAPPPRPTPVAGQPRAAAPAASPYRCRHCGSERLSIQHGKYGYYFKCAACDGNTPIRLGCGKEGHRERLRKDGPTFHRECADCGTSAVFFVNPSQGSMPGPGGMRIICRTKPEWGLGQVLRDDGGAKVTAFFLSAGKRTLDTTVAELDLVTGAAASNPILDVAAQANWRHAHHNLYVIELKPEVFTLETKFLEANLGYLPGTLPCVYVGMTASARQPRRALRQALRRSAPPATLQAL